jgi:hypothetical protein
MQRLGKNRGGYYGEVIGFPSVAHEIELAAGQHGWSSEVFHQTADFTWQALRLTPSRITHHAPRIYISTGIHGDEPAGPLAALRLLQENRWPANAEIILLPCLNPVGLAQNKRENGQGIDLNRDYLQPRSDEIKAHIAWLEKQPAFDLCLCLHEDWESHGFYVYELNPDRRPSLAEAIIAGVGKVCPIDHSEVIEGRAAQGGITVLSRLISKQALCDGLLVPVLEEFPLPDHWLKAFIPQSRVGLARVQALLTAVRGSFAPTPPWELP